MSDPRSTSSYRSLRFLAPADLAGHLTQYPTHVQDWVARNGFTAERGAVLAIPDTPECVRGEVWVGLGTRALDLALSLGLPDRLPPGTYTCRDALEPSSATTLALGFAIGGYRFGRYKALAAPMASLELPSGVDGEGVHRMARADGLARDLINTPAQDLGPAALADAVCELARRHGGTAEVIVGDALIAQGFPAVHAVGRSGAEAPRVAIYRGGATDGPLVALVGKGVCFDTGGLDLKPSSGMALMKKDMGGAAVAIAIAELILSAHLPVRLLVVVPAVENGVGPLAYRPGDVLATRTGATVEVTNTDAEGRIVLADTLAYAAESAPEVLIDLATLTGAARVALGPELPAVYGNDPAWVHALLESGTAVTDPLWPMPLWEGYEDELTSRVADLQNASSSGFAGSITAALFLSRFVPREQPWLHLDLYAWNPKERPGKPVGAWAHGVRAVFELLQRRYGG